MNETIRIVLIVLLVLVALQVLVPVLAVMFAFGAAFFGLTVGGIVLIPALGYGLLGGSTAWTVVLCLSVAVALLMPLYVLIRWAVTFSRTQHHPGARFWIVCALLWLLSLCGMAASAVKALVVNGPELKEILMTLDEWEDSDSLDCLDYQDCQDDSDKQDYSYKQGCSDKQDCSDPQGSN